MKQQPDPLPSAFAAPGIGLDEAGIIALISHEFGLVGTDWVRSRNRTTRESVARQLLWKCLIDHLRYTQLEAGAVSLKSGCNARHGKIQIEDTFWDDPQYGEKIKVVYFRCVEIKRGIMGGMIK